MKNYLKSIIILVVVFGIYGFVHHNHEVSKQKDAQAQTEIVQTTKIINDNTHKFLLQGCLKTADINYNNFVKNNSDYSVVEDGNTLYSMSKTKWDFVNSQKKTDYDACNKLY